MIVGEVEKKDIAVSVIIPAYNVEDYIADCLDSLVNQSLDNIEILVVNDGSTDNTQSIIDEYVSLYPDKIRSFVQENGGPSKARNLALDEAKGLYVGFVDSDDKVTIEMFEKMYNLAAEQNADLVLCGRAYVEGKDNIASVWMPKKITDSTNIFQTNNLLPDTSSFLWDKLFKRELIEEHQFRFDQEIHYAEDALFVYCFLYYANKVCSIQEALYLYTVRRDGSITGSFDARMLHEVYACKKLTDFYIDIGVFNIFKDKLLWICIGFWGRKFYSFYQTPKGKKIKYQFVCEFYDFLEQYYPKWKDFLRKYATKGDKKKYKINYYKTNKKLVKLYVYMPATVIKTVKLGRKILAKIKKSTRNFVKKYKYRFLGKHYYENYLICRDSEQIIDNQILFISNSGDNLACNPFYLAKEACERNKYKIYFGSKNPARDRAVLEKMGLQATVLKMDSGVFQKILATSKYLISNYRFPTYFCKREGQIVMNTWHGTPLKFLGRHMNNGLADIGNVQSQFLASDYLIYPNEYTKVRMLDAFLLNDLFSNNVLVNGYPRNSVFLDRSYEKALRRKLGIENKKVFIYMPTWRGTSVSMTNGQYFNTMNMFLNEIDQKLNDNVILFVKMHNLASKKVRLSGYKHIRSFPDNLEIYYFLNVADALITDYSSVFYDFANTGKEIILFTYDKDIYLEERGLYMDIDDLPFTKVSNVDSLIEYMNAWSGFVPSVEYEEFCKLFCSFDSENVPQKINDIFLLQSNNINYTNTSKKYTVCFTPGLDNDEIVEKCLEIMQVKPNPLFVFATYSINPQMEELLKSELLKDIKYIIVQNEKVFTKDEFLAIDKGRKRGYLNAQAQNALLREKDRMLPGISIFEAINLTENPLFTDLTDLLNKHINDRN